MFSLFFTTCWIFKPEVAMFKPFYMPFSQLSVWTNTFQNYIRDTRVLPVFYMIMSSRLSIILSLWVCSQVTLISFRTILVLPGTYKLDVPLFCTRYVHVLIKARDRLRTHDDHYNPFFQLIAPFWKHNAKSSKLLDNEVFLGWTLHFYIGLLLFYVWTRLWLSFSIQSFIVRCCLTIFIGLVIYFVIGRFHQFTFW